jgi:hypothetical protein
VPGQIAIEIALHHAAQGAITSAKRIRVCMIASRSSASAAGLVQARFRRLAGFMHHTHVPRCDTHHIRVVGKYGPFQRSANARKLSILERRRSAC